MPRATARGSRPDQDPWPPSRDDCEIAASLLGFISHGRTEVARFVAKVCRFWEDAEVTRVEERPNGGPHHSASVRVAHDGFREETLQGGPSP